MDTDRLDVEVSSFEPSTDGRTFVYRINVSYGVIKWSLFRRFSEFYNLNNELFAEGYAMLPSLPPKTILRPNQPEIAKERCAKLNTFLLQLLIRPDLRLSRPLVNWLQFEENVGVSIDEIKLRPNLATMENKFAVTDFAYLSELSMFIVSQADITPLSKLGKAWTLIEPEQVGGFYVYTFTLNNDDQTPISSPRSCVPGGLPSSMCVPALIERIAGQAMSRRLNTCALLHRNQNVNLLFGTGQGELCVYALESLPTGQVAARPESRFEVHIKAPFIQMKKYDADLIASIGADNAVRLLTFPPANPTSYQMISGGRITKPLDKNEALTCIHLEAESRRIFVGTSFGKLLIYTVEAHPPTWIATIDVAAGLESLAVIRPSVTVPFDIPVGLIESAGSNSVSFKPPIACMCVSVDRRHLILGIENEVVLLNLTCLISTTDPSVTLVDLKMEKLRVEFEVTSLCCRELSGYQFLFVAMERVIAIYRLDDRRLLQAIDFYTWGRIHKIEVLDVPCLFSLIDFSPVKTQPSLTVATSNRGVQFIPLINLDTWLSWPAGEAKLQQNTRATTLEVLPTILKPPIEDETESEKDLQIIQAFGSAVF